MPFRTRQTKSIIQGRQQLGAATALPVNELQGTDDVLSIRSYRNLYESLRTPSKEQHIEGLMAFYTSQQTREKGFAHIKKESPHRAGAIPDTNIIPRHDLLWLDTFRWLYG